MSVLQDLSWNPGLGSCYLVVTTKPQNQPEANAACAQHGHNVHLVAIETAEEQAFLESFLPPHNTG